MTDRPVIDESMDEIVQEFLAESAEGLEQFDRDIIELETNPSSHDHLSSAFRIFHTIKGTSGFLGYPLLEEVTHGAETLLSLLRDQELVLDKNRTNVLLAAGDTIRVILAAIGDTGLEPDMNVDEIVARLKEAQSSGTPQPSVNPPSPATQSSENGVETNRDAVGDDSATGSGLSTDQQDTSQKSSPPVSTMPESQLESGSAGARSITDRTVRVDVELLDTLMRQVGELVLARNEVISSADHFEDIALSQTVSRLSLIVSELQEGVMKTRMQPLAHMWSSLPRLVRDLCAQFNKKVNLEMDGGETELDRTVLEAIRGPFTHLIRNSLDHGIEDPDVRVAKGKQPTGQLTVRAFHEGGQVVLETIDDGGGINLEKVASKAISTGLLSQEQIDRMSQREIIELIFSPGFSTAEKVTSVSGRGVGMDVVRSNIESIGGTVDVYSEFDRGTTFRIRIPLTLAIIPALLISSRQQRFAIPQPNLVEMLHIGTQASPTEIEQIGEASVFRLRGDLLPLVRLDKLLGFPDDGRPSDGPATVAVLQDDELKFGLIFDEVFETQEIVVKPLGSLVKQIDAFAGATILGDGSVALILDVAGLASLGGIKDAAIRISFEGKSSHEDKIDEGSKSAFVILRVGENRTVAIPVDQIARLEEIEANDVEKSGEIDVVQYRGSLMRLVRLHEVLGILGHTVVPGEPLKVVVHESDHGPIGFVVADMVDVLEDTVDLMDVDSGYGLAGAVVLHGRVTDVLDLEAAILWMQREGFFADAR